MAAVTATVFFILSLFTTSYSAIIYSGSIAPNFTTTRYRLIDNLSGEFLRSINRTYTAAIRNPQPKSTSFYLVVYHTASDTVIWAANRNQAISDSGEVRLSYGGITIHDVSGELIWSTPTLNSRVGALQLLDSGNLILVDDFNKTLWQSFDHPTDTVVAGQRFSAGKSLTTATSDADYSEGDYTFKLTPDDGILQWQNLTYFTLLMDTKSIQNSNPPITYLLVNGSGFYVFGDPVSKLAIQVLITPAAIDSAYRILKVTKDGRLVVNRYVNKAWVTDFMTPSDSCGSPFQCAKLGLCSAGSCSCPPGFRTDPITKRGCSLSDTSLSLPESCTDNKTRQNSNSSRNYVYVPLGAGMKYVPIDFMDPNSTGIGLSTCKDMCSSSCSCLGLFHGNQSGSCHLIDNNFGSIVSQASNRSDDKLGYVKAVSISVSGRNKADGSGFSVIGLILLPGSGVLVIIILAVWIIRRAKNNKTKRKSKQPSENSYSGDLEMFSIAGLPVLFDYEDLVEATVNFSTRIGSGGFGTVYKGVLRDKTVVAVKKITALGAQGKKEFGTEIAIIGNIHHVNLVKLKGFCAHGRERFLVYEYMSRGSLDRTLFGPGPPMEWQERFEIAVGTARGLAYLHSGCEHKIIHCDVKPENILLSDNMQVKISDFGLSKLLSPEQSGLFTTMRGTRGYLAPEWLTNAAISDKTDVYSYGMVLLELIQGRKNCVRAPSHGSGNASTSTDGQSSISSGSHHRPRARAFYFPLQALEMHEEGRYLDLVEPRLAGRVTNIEAEKLVKVALCCLHEDPTLRPTMANVVAMLEGTVPVGEPRVECLNFLRFYGRRFTEPSTAVTGAEIKVPSGFMVATVYSSSPSASPNSFSYMSSQQLSGPR
ncbi:G-type lectin S-receptor-like serine/threonine-protein kinase At5g35370 [Bidens hawaiensis]|uniref:G-type lectin S-receptor-like serine/threonine-protein kinase At5g35370 n=1 Tax=Bidens hawaiensis TaxID=980011 RepID=UPI00404A63B9